MDSSKIMDNNIRPRPLLLKDYLFDDVSSCSSNGFRSLPRTQCCNTVRFLLELDLKNKHHPHGRRRADQSLKKTLPTLLKSPSKSALLAFQSVITAVKCLPFASQSLSENKRCDRPPLSRSVSKKIFKTSSTLIWKKPSSKSGSKEIGRWKSFEELLKEDYESSDRPDNAAGDGEDNSKFWEEREVTKSEEDAWSGKFEKRGVLLLTGAENDVVEVITKANNAINGVGEPNDDVLTDSTNRSDGNTNKNAQKPWPNEEKEQFSPVSVIDCPFDDEDEVSSPFGRSLSPEEGTEAKHMNKIQMFESLAQLDPVNLTKRYADQTHLPYLSPSNDDESIISNTEDDHSDAAVEHKAMHLLHRIKNTFRSDDIKLSTERLILDFFGEKMSNEFVKWGELLEEVGDWLDGCHLRDSFLGWEVQINRLSYLKSMEIGGEWKKLDQQSEEVAAELGKEVFDAMLDELLVDM